MKLQWWHIFLLLTPVVGVLYWLNTYGSTAGTLVYPLFGLSLLALIPLAQLNGDLVSVLSEGTSRVFAGLLNACLGNVPEIAIGIWLLLQVVWTHSLQGPNYLIIQGMLLGSVIGNILLTLGLATLAGALRHGRLRFSHEKAAGFASMLGLAVVGLALPTLATDLARAEAKTASTEEAVSLVVSVILMISYVAYILVEFFRVGEKKSVEGDQIEPATGEHHAAHHAHETGRPTAAEERQLALERERLEQLQREEEAKRSRAAKPMSFGKLTTLLTAMVISIGLIAGVCYALVSVTDAAIVTTPLTPLSFGLIVIPIITNFGELIEAWRAAWNKRMEEAMEVAAGSSVQVPLFVTPVIVFVGLLFSQLTPGVAPLTLIFQPLALIVLGLVVFVYALVNLDGETTWLEGLQLLAFYAMIAVTSFALPGR